MVSAVSQEEVGSLWHDAAAWALYERCRRKEPVKLDGDEL